MKYLGGKFKQGIQIAPIIQRFLVGNKTYYEPFCGSAWVASRLNPTRPMILSDISKPIITMWKALQNPDIKLPDEITKEQYEYYKKTRDENDWMTAYVGFGASFMGKYFGGYAGISGKKNIAKSMQYHMNKKRFLNAYYYHASYDEMEYRYDSIVYCDPPYYNRTKGHNYKDAFDHSVFWNWVRKMVSKGHLMLITEYTIPDDFKVVHDFGNTITRQYNTKAHTDNGLREVLCCHESQLSKFNI